MSSGAGPEPDPAAPSAGRAYIGLGVFGWGLAILLQLAPHEDPVVGGGLTLFGAALLITAPRFPRVDRVPRLAIGLAGLGAAAAVAAFEYFLGDGWNLPKATIVALGLGLALLSPFLDRSLPLPRGRRLPMATAAATAIAVLAAPLVLWVVQAVFERFLGTTPIELFIEYGLIVPMAAALALFGWDPAVYGQTIQYDTPRGALRVEVGAACSGVEAMALFGGILALFLLVERPGGLRMAAWTTVGLLGVYLANVLRLIVLGVVGYHGGADALLQVHAQAGWIFFVGWALLFAWLVRASRPRAYPKANAQEQPAPMVFRRSLRRAAKEPPPYRGPIPSIPRTSR